MNNAVRHIANRYGRIRDVETDADMAIVDAQLHCERLTHSLKMDIRSLDYHLKHSGLNGADTLAVHQIRDMMQEWLSELQP